MSTGVNFFPFCCSGMPESRQVSELSRNEPGGRAELILRFPRDDNSPETDINGAK